MSYRVSYRPLYADPSQDLVCVASFLSEGDARTFAIDLARRPCVGAVKLDKKGRTIWEADRSAGMVA